MDGETDTLGLTLAETDGDTEGLFDGDMLTLGLTDGDADAIVLIYY